MHYFAADLDNDGDQDVLSASWINDNGTINGEITWYECIITTNTNNIEANVSIYPNPSSGLISIEYLTNYIKPISILINDISGKLIYKLEMKGFNDSKIDSSIQSSGIYFITIESETSVFIEKIIIN